MKTEVSIEIPNALLFIMDPESSDIPDTTGDGPIAVADSCVVVGTQAAVDGPTNIILADKGPPLDRIDLERVLPVTKLRLSAGRVVVCTCEMTVLLAVGGLGQHADAEIWANDNDQPDSIWIRVASRQSGIDEPDVTACRTK